MRFDFDNLIGIFMVIILGATVVAILSLPFVMYFNPCSYKTCIVWEQNENK